MKILYSINSNADYGIGYIAQTQIEGLMSQGNTTIVFRSGRGSDEEFDSGVAAAVRALPKNIHSSIDVAVIWANCGLSTMKVLKDRGIPTVLVRASTHVDWQNRVLSEEYPMLQTHPRKETAIPQAIVERMREEYVMADIILTPSDFAAKTFPAHRQEKVRVLPFGVDSEFFKPDPVPHDGFRVGFVGCNTVRKGLGYLEKVIDEFWCYPTLKNIEGLTLTKAVGNMPLQEMPKFYNSLDVFCLPSLEEGNSMAVNEALACGVPIVATHECGVWEGFPGILIRPKDHWAIAKAISKIYYFEPERMKLRVAAGRKLAEEYTWGRHTDGLIEICEEVVKGGS